MINRYFKLHPPRAHAMHAEPSAALAALKLASLDAYEKCGPERHEAAAER